MADQDQITSTLKFLKLHFEKLELESEDLFAKIRNLDDKTLLEYIVSKDDLWIRVREELIELLKCMEHKKDPKHSQDNLKRLMKKKLKTSPGLVGCLNSIDDKFPWSKTMAGFMKFKSFLKNILLGYVIWFFDVVTDILFANDVWNLWSSYELGSMKAHTRDTMMPVFIITVIHIALPWVASLLVYSIMILPDILHNCRENICSLILGRFPVPLFTKFRMFLLEIGSYDLKTKLEENKRNCVENRKSKEDIEIENKEIKRNSVENKKFKDNIETQEAFVNLSLILEGTVESSFQLWFQVLYFFPLLVFFIRDSYEWSFGVRTLSILSSFISYGISIVNSR